MPGGTWMSLCVSMPQAYYRRCMPWACWRCLQPVRSTKSRSIDPPLLYSALLSAVSALQLAAIPLHTLSSSTWWYVYIIAKDIGLAVAVVPETLR